MSNVYFIGCLHLEHENMAKHRGFNNSAEHDAYLISQWNSVINKKDLVYILGDVTMESDKYEKLALLKGRKIVVLGNHDLPKHTRYLLSYVESVGGMVEYKGYALTHCPISEEQIVFYRGNIHAHIHENPSPIGRNFIIHFLYSYIRNPIHSLLFVYFFNKQILP